MRSVYLPLSKVDKCHNCGKSGSDLRLCSSCAERIYCSPECQKKDWPVHKVDCGKTDRIELGSFYPYLATLAERCHPHGDKPVHPALTHQILTNVNPGTSAVDLPDGSFAKLLVLGDEIGFPAAFMDDGKKWWPLAKSPSILNKMRRRIICEGYVLPITLAICYALLAEMYTTTSKAGSSERRNRLRYRSSPIADFGIAAGSADVKCQDQLAYWMPDGEIVKGQDPDDHYWIYFTTARGTEVVLDCAMFTFNMCMMVQSDPYLSGSDLERFAFVPAFFGDKVIQKNAPPLHKERRRFSIMRNEALHAVIRSSNQGLDAYAIVALTKLMNEIAGRKCARIEEHLLCSWVLQDMALLRKNFQNGDWKQYPPTPPMAIANDPGELDDLDSREADWAKMAKKWKREKKMSKQRRG